MARVAEDRTVRSVHTHTLPEILRAASISLVVTTYQANRIVVLRAAGADLNTHLRSIHSPMGVAASGARLAVGTRAGVVEYRDVPAAAAQLPRDPQPHDACYVVRRTHVTGDVRVHDIAYAGDELWIVATKFSCLATLASEYSFVPRWKPAFVSALSGDDRCHLNGLAVVDGRPRYVTALGPSDVPRGWREQGPSAGVLIDVESSETILGGLEMPHSPRWHRDRLWLLQSATGTLSQVDLAAGRAEPVARVPGFARGLGFAGPLAFVAVSRVRDESTFGALPGLAAESRSNCGVWVVDTESGQVRGFVRFEQGIEELFDVAVLHGRAFPEIAAPDDEVTESTFVIPAAIGFDQ